MYLLAVTDPDNDLGDFERNAHVIAASMSHLPIVILPNSDRSQDLRVTKHSPAGAQHAIPLSLPEGL